MKKLFFLFLCFFLFTAAGCESSKTGTSTKDTGKSANIENVCEYFSKDFISSVIGKPVVRTEQTLVDNGCAYYTEYSETYNYAPGGNTPGGRAVYVIFENIDAEKYKQDKTELGGSWAKNPNIAMDNIIAKSASGSIYHVGLILGPNEVLRAHFIQDAIDQPTLVKLQEELAKKMSK